MKAAVCREFGKQLLVEDVDIGSPHRGEVRVTIKACGICRSDVHSIDGAWGGTLPAIFGHEAAGIVDEVGEGVEGLQSGQHAVVTLVRSCHACYFCSQGEPVFCEGVFRLDGEMALTAAGGTPVRQGLHTAAFAESVLVDASQVVAIPNDVPFASACLLACAVMTGFGAVVNTARVQPGESVVVIGTGGVGLNAVQAAAIAGARPIIAIDISNTRLDAACHFGATHAINSTTDDAEAAVWSITGNRGADAVIVTAGSGRAVELGTSLLRRAGRLVLVGMPPAGVRSSIHTAEFANDGQRIISSKMGSSVPAVEVPRLIRLYQAGRLKLDELVSRHFGLTEINEAIASAKRGEAIRNVVMFDT